jgi:hypothetical protein
MQSETKRVRRHERREVNAIEEGRLDELAVCDGTFDTHKGLLREYDGSFREGGDCQPLEIGIPQIVDESIRDARQVFPEINELFFRDLVFHNELNRLLKTRENGKCSPERLCTIEEIESCMLVLAALSEVSKSNSHLVEVRKKGCPKAGHECPTALKKFSGDAIKGRGSPGPYILTAYA